RANFPGETIWDTLEEEIEARTAFLKRQSEIADITDKIRRSLRREPPVGNLSASSVAGVCRAILAVRHDSLELVSAELEGARAKYTGEAVWPTLEAEIEERRAFLKAESEIVERLNHLLERGGVAEAEQKLSEARERYPDEEFWGLFLTEIRVYKQLKAKWVDISRMAQTIRELVHRDDLPGARAELTAAQSRYPQEA